MIWKFLKTPMQTSRNACSNSGVINAMDSACLFAADNWPRQSSDSFLPNEEEQKESTFWFLKDKRNKKVFKSILPNNLFDKWKKEFQCNTPKRKENSLLNINTLKRMLVTLSLMSSNLYKI